MVLMSLNNPAAIMAANTGHIIQVVNILIRVAVSVGLDENKFQPTIAPTMA
jgi:hypothetical protein